MAFKASKPQKYKDLSQRNRFLVKEWAKETVNGLYEKQGLPPISQDSEEVRIIAESGRYIFETKSGKEQVVRIGSDGRQQ